MTVFDVAIEAEGLKDFFKSVGKATVNFGNEICLQSKKKFRKCNLNRKCRCN